MAVVVLAVLLAVGVGVTPQRSGESEDRDDVPPSRLPLRYSGEGEKELGDINLTGDAEIEWTNRPEIAGTGFFSVDDEGRRMGASGVPRLHVSSTAERGTERVAPGVYRKLHVEAQGRWTMEIRAAEPSEERAPPRRQRRKRGRDKRS